MALWSGRTGETELAPEVRDFLRAEDAELLPYDCRGTLLHAERLHAAGILSADELAAVRARLEEIAALGAEAIDETDEDVHSAIERQLGELGKKIHAGRSRNDQVVTAFRLYVVEACTEAEAEIVALGHALLDTAEGQVSTLMPGYTHLQRAQPVTVAHHLLAWVEMLERDLDRLELAAAHARPSPLGAGALAGSTLGLPSPPDQVRNSLDGVADRDFAHDYLYAVAALFVHLSRISEELILWVSSEFGFARLPEAAATGSSMMPQKLNPDVAELARGKAGTAIGRLTGLLATVKGLPLAYNLDLQEDKRPVFEARADTVAALAALRVVVSGLEFDADRLAAAAADPHLLATDEAERHVASGDAFRDAYRRVAASVREGTFATSSTAQESVAARTAPGPGSASQAIEAARDRLQTRDTASGPSS